MTAGEEVAQQQRRALRGNRDFKIVAAGQVVSALGDAVTITAMPLLVLFLTGSGALMGVVAALQVVPDLILGMFVGALADRWDRRRMIMWADAGRALLTAAIPLAYWLDGPTMAVVLIVAIPTNTLRLFSDAGLGSALPSLVGRENLGLANSYLEATLSLPFIVGPALAGLMVASIGAPATLAVDALSFVLSAASMLAVRRELRAEREGKLPTLLADIKDGVAFVWNHRVLRATISYWSAVSITTAGIVPTLGFYVTIDRDFGPELFGYIGSAWSIGYLVGSLAAGRLRGPRMGLRMMVVGLVIGAQLVTIAVTSFAAVYLVAAALIGGALAVMLITYATLRASLTPDAYLGRVGATSRTLSAGLQPIGLMAAGGIIELADAGVALSAMGAALIAATAVAGLSRSARRASMPAPDPAPASSS